MSNVFGRTYNFLQRAAHEQPAFFYACLVGSLGPIAAVVVPPVRKTYFGYKPPPPLPTTYPLPQRKRDAGLQGYEDE